MNDLGPRVVEQTLYGNLRRHIIDPADFTCAGLVAALADTWVALAPEIPGSAPMVASAIRAFGRFLDDLLPVHTAKALALGQIRRMHLDDWERDLLRRQRREHSEIRYRYAVHLFALLRRIDDDQPGVLDAEVAERVRAQTRLHHIRRPGPAEFSTWERRRLIRAAKALATRELASARRDHFVGPSRDGLIALAVLLGFGTGEPPEVLRGLRVTDIVPLQADPTDRRSADELALEGGADAYLVRFTKRRAGVVYEDIIARHQRLAHWSLTTLLAATGAPRTRLDTDLLWLWAPQRPRGEPVIQAPWTREWSLRSWVARQVTGPTDDLRPEISEPITYSRLRKTLVAREAVEDPARYLRTDRRHSAETFFAHYASSPVLRAHAGKVLIDAIGEMFDHAIAGPVVVTPGAAAALATGASTPALDGVDVTALLSGGLDGPLAACRAPLESPHAPSGTACPSYANGQCYSCPNAVITSRHLAAVVRLVEVLDPDRFGRVDAWRALWEPTYRFLTEVVLPQFPPDAVEEARAAAGSVYLDGGLLQTIGSTDARS